MQMFSPPGTLEIVVVSQSLPTYPFPVCPLGETSFIAPLIEKPNSFARRRRFSRLCELPFADGVVVRAVACLGRNSRKDARSLSSFLLEIGLSERRAGSPSASTSNFAPEARPFLIVHPLK